MTGALSPAALERLVFRLEGPVTYTRRGRAKRGADVDESVRAARVTRVLTRNARAISSHALDRQTSSTHSMMHTSSCTRVCSPDFRV
jgi:uncharacterized protein (DUF2384 family)